MTTQAQQSAVERMLRHHEIEQFLTHEASLYDERRYNEWLDLLTDDIRYYMPMLRNVKFGEHERELTREMEDLNWIDEGKDILTKRIEQILTGVHWAEEPLSRIVHVITNVLIEDDRGDEVDVKCKFVTYRNRVETETDLFIGRREDTLRMVDGWWKIARRKVILAQSVLLAKNLTLLF
ncbi:MAG: 3-phenylpropionate/cinnamic acid dioxygenase subunit beta [Dehalococcoidia bacterium]|nr:3-phenylpropionate/cinnamic acid dioxygenase subunit beta [Dehalococcoidia bacterium]